jgi:flavin reductase (DIM6/NTAB) family NADH-FMN oxidoreductase RutF
MLMQDAGIDARALRNALGHYATGVAVITTRTPQGANTGVTVNSFTSVSLAPPLVLFCLANRANVLAAFEQAGHFAINVLARGQQGLSNRFARPSSNNWDDVAHRAGEHGCAMLEGALASFECVRRAAYPGGDHLILVGEVLRFEAAPIAEPLVFYQGSYGTFARDQEGARASPDGSLSDFVSYWG